MHRALRLAHCSDIHLDSDYYGGDWNRARHDRDRALFDGLLEAICAGRPDLLLLAGDLFDHNRATVDTVEWACERLANLPFPVVMIPGNHDCLAENAVYHRHDFAAAGLHLLLDPAGQTLTLPELGWPCGGGGWSITIQATGRWPIRRPGPIRTCGTSAWRMACMCRHRASRAIRHPFMRTKSKTPISTIWRWATSTAHGTYQPARPLPGTAAPRTRCWASRAAF